MLEFAIKARRPSRRHLNHEAGIKPDGSGAGSHPSSKLHVGGHEKLPTGGHESAH